jgi:hypothetical protein
MEQYSISGKVIRVYPRDRDKRKPKVKEARVGLKKNQALVPVGFGDREL